MSALKTVSARNRSKKIELIFSEELLIDENTDALIQNFEKAAVMLCVREEIDPDVCEVSITFENEEGIRELNAKYRGKDEVTDVLSFPMYDSLDDLFEEAETLEDEAVISLGDVVICTEVAKRQAQEFGHSEQREIVYLFVHSMLHLLGYDHEDEDERTEMRKVEEIIMHELKLER